MDLVCGYLYSEDPLFDPSLGALPPVFVVRPPRGSTATWVHASIAYSIQEATPSNASPNPLSTRLPELVLIEVLRLHLASTPPADHGWIPALNDPVLGVAVVARRVGYESEEAFSRAFKRARGISPSHWRARRPRDDDA